MCIFAVLATALLTRVPKWMGDFDQSFYLTIAYDIDRYGVFSNGMFDQVNSVDTAPPPGMFIAPLYPWLVLAVQKDRPALRSVQQNAASRPTTTAATAPNAMNTRCRCTSSTRCCLRSARWRSGAPRN